MTPMLRKCIRITAKDSPNVQLALWQREKGLPITGEMVVPGVLSWEKYQFRLRTFNPQRVRESLEAEWYTGAELMLFPPDWMARAAGFAKARNVIKEKATSKRTMGIDPGEGGDPTAWCIGDRQGALFLLAKRTPDTTEVVDKTLALMREWNVAPEDVCFDRGGGGKEHADRLRSAGKNVRTVAFGETIVPEPKRSMRFFSEKIELHEDKGAYVNRRAELYGEASVIFDPSGGLQGIGGPLGYGLPTGGGWEELRRQLELMPKLEDKEGRLRMLPKRKPAQGMPKPEDATDEGTLIGRIGCSPDEADAFVLMIHAHLHRPTKAQAGGF